MTRETKKTASLPEFATEDAKRESPGRAWRAVKCRGRWRAEANVPTSGGPVAVRVHLEQVPAMPGRKPLRRLMWVATVDRDNHDGVNLGFGIDATIAAALADHGLTETAEPPSAAEGEL
jgi:hypothetical protein